jgi:peroxiredoxin
VEELYKEFGGRIEFIGINLGIKGKIGDFVKHNHITFPVAYDEGDKVSKAFGARIETNVLIDRKGVITYLGRGVQEDLRKYLRKALE